MNSNATLGLLVGIFVAAAAILFIVTGWEFGGKTTVEGDQDLPPITTNDQN